jgi:tetratricopeptide (TPR) repeat protein
MSHALNTSVRSHIADVIVDACALAGWLCLDVGAIRESWDFYERAKTAAQCSGSVASLAYVCAAQSVVLIDVGLLGEAQELADRALVTAGLKVPRRLRAWLQAAQGEAYAARGERSQSLHAFDRALMFLYGSDPGETPYLVFDEVQLARWRGAALAELGDRSAIDQLTATLAEIDPTFHRARASAHADLAKALFVHGEREGALTNARMAHDLATQIGSVRQRDRVKAHVADG